MVRYRMKMSISCPLNNTERLLTASRWRRECGVSASLQPFYPEMWQLLFLSFHFHFLCCSYFTLYQQLWISLSFPLKFWCVASVEQWNPDQIVRCLCGVESTIQPAMRINTWNQFSMENGSDELPDYIIPGDETSLWWCSATPLEGRWI